MPAWHGNFRGLSSLCRIRRDANPKSAAVPRYTPAEWPMPPIRPLARLLDTLVTEASWYAAEADGRLRCFACGHRCLIGDGKRGICKVRFNREGKLMVPTGYVGAVQCDPTEKKPFFHVLPGSDALTFGMLGCDLHCAYCQNWVTSRLARS